MSWRVFEQCFMLGFVKTLLFDMAGTVFDSPVDWERENRAGARALVARLWQAGKKVADEKALIERIFEEGRVRRARAKAEGVEYQLRELLRKVLAEVSVNLSEDELDQAVLTYIGPELAVTKPFPGALDVLRQLQTDGVQQMLLSNTPAPEFVRESLARAGMTELFQDVIISADVGFRKPHLKFLEAVRARVSFDRAKTVLVGDRLYDDIEGAQKLGVRGILFGAAEHADNLAYAGKIVPDARVDNFPELYTLVKRWL